MKLLNADKLVDFINSKEKNAKWRLESGEQSGITKMVRSVDLLSFISTNSIEVEQIKPKGIVEINDEIMEREYENYLDAIYIHKADVKASNNSHNIEKELNVGKSCVNCGQIKDERCRGRWTNVCENWTPKADKVEK
jgi:hypothetical protein